MSGDGVDKLVLFLAKRDGVDKLVKTLQYVSKLVHWRAGTSRPDIARRAKCLETASGLGRKAFRSGRSLSGLNTLRRSPGPTPAARLLALFANSGEMVYFFFDHLVWLSRVGVLNPASAPKFSFISAFGEALGYVFFVVSDLIAIAEGIVEERESDRAATTRIRAERAMRLAAVAANVADFVIAVADVEPNRFCNHAVTLGVSGLVSAWSGWYRNWPS